MSSIAISVNGLVKEYEVYSKPMDLALEILTRRPRHTTFRALDGLSFDVMRGEVLGIIGSNGAGKSTLLKIITGVLDASDGSVNIAGRVTAILELGLGFNLEYSGRENIYLSGLLYGMSRDEIDEKLDAIIDFSGLAEFIERPVKTYSSGMQSRLAFSIATAVDPEILIIDEALAAGDSAFVQKCLRRIRALCSGGRTVLLVSHGTGLLAQLCQRVMWLERGRIKMVGPAIQVVQAYDLAAHQAADSRTWIDTIDDDLHVAAGDHERGEGARTSQPASGQPAGGALAAADARALFGSAGDTGKQVFRRGPVLIDSVEMLDSAGQVTNRLTLLKPFTLRVHYHVEGDIPAPTLGIAIAVNNKLDLSPVGQFMTQNIRPFETRETYDSAPDRKPAHRRGALVASFDYTPFRKGEYLLSLGLIPNEPATWEFYEYRHLYYSFSVDDAGMDVGAPVWLNPRVRNIAKAEPAGEAAQKPGIEPSPAVPAPVCETRPATLRSEIEAICFGEGGYPDAWPRHTACPACGVGPLAPAFAKYGFTHARCDACGFVCVDPYPPEEVLKKLYNGRYYTQVREFFELPMRRVSGMATPFSAPESLLLKVVEAATAGRKAGRWLDVGGGIGTFAELVRNEKPRWQVYLNELNMRSAEVAQEEFGLQVITDDLQTLKASGQSFDVISSVAVLEHITDPLSFMTACMDILAPGGCLANVLPQFTPLNAAISRGASPNVVPPYHVSLFNERAMLALTARIPNCANVAVEQYGDAAFHLIEHVDFGDHWDVTIPSEVDATPRSVFLKPYSEAQSHALNVLAEADAKIGSFFAETDGKLFLASYVWKKG